VQAAHAIGALEELSGGWAIRPDKRHPLLGPPQIHPTLIRGGAFISNVPEHCELSINSTYLPGNADGAGYGSVPKGEIEQAVARVADDDDWPAEHRPAWRWLTDYPPAEIDPESEVVAVISQVCRELGRDPVLSGMDSAYDGALLTRFAATPSPAWGPGDLGLAHAVDESIGVDELVLAARLYVRMLLSWCR
jgi:acetylornithine deacetylase/succinyl-diaminopimelate desuccinylase-like protein